MDTIKNFFTPEVLWFIVGIILLIMEFATPGLVIFFFGIGALVVGVICLFFNPSFTMQLFIFLISSIAFAFSLRKWLKSIFLGKSHNAGDIDDNTSNFIGEQAIVIEAITPEVPGTVELHGTPWKAKSKHRIKQGTLIKVIEINNLLLTVEPLNKK